MLNRIMETNLPERHIIELLPTWGVICLLSEKTDEPRISKIAIYQTAISNRNITLERMKRLEAAGLIELHDKYITVNCKESWQLDHGDGGRTATNRGNSTARNRGSSSPTARNRGSSDDTHIIERARAQQQQHTAVSTNSAAQEKKAVDELAPFLQMQADELERKGYKGGTIHKWRNNPEASAIALLHHPQVVSADWNAAQWQVRWAINDLIDDWFQDNMKEFRARYKNSFTRGLGAYLAGGRKRKKKNDQPAQQDLDEGWSNLENV